MIFHKITFGYGCAMTLENSQTNLINIQLIKKIMNNITIYKKYNKPQSLYGNRTNPTLCPQCLNVHYKGVWYAPDSRFALLINKEKDQVIYQQCPACDMQNSGLFIGVLYVKDIPKQLKDQVQAMIINEAKHVCFENPQNRVIDFFEVTDGYKITATSADMAHRIGERIQNSFDGCEIKLA
jgi:NMD protein affecting ribosome stability and mRNA decay